MTEVDPQQQEAMQIFEKGHRLYQLVSLSGYTDLLDIFETIAVEYEARLLSMPSGEPDQFLRDLHTEAKVARSVFNIVQNQIMRTIEQSKQATIAQTDNQPSYNGF